MSKMIDFGGILDDLFVGLSYELLKAGMKELIERAPEITRDATRDFGNKRINKLKKNYVRWRFRNNSYKEWNKSNWVFRK